MNSKDREGKPIASLTARGIYFLEKSDHPQANISMQHGREVATAHNGSPLIGQLDC